MRLLPSLTLAALAVSTAPTVAADPLAPPAPETTLGFRIGGYGFRREGDPRPVSGWNECRMNGLGLFGQRGLRGPWFVEAGLDGYFTQDFILSSPSTDLRIDRMSALVSGAIGARTRLAARAIAYVQLGAGLELARASVPYGDTGATIRADKAMPEGFFGVGTDFQIAPGTYIGASLRLLGMGNFVYAETHLKMPSAWTTTPTPDQVFAASPDFAVQGQFYVRRAL